MKLKRRGLIATIIYHTLLLLLLVFAGLTFPDPPPEEEGILVNFGTDDTGFGQFEPMGGNPAASEPEQPVVEQEQELVEESYEPPPEPVEEYIPPDPTPVDNTQDVEETRVREEPKPTAEELEQQRLERERIERERQQREEAERQRLEQERLERERLERERQAREEQERIQRERQARQEQLQNMGRNAFANQGQGNAEGSQGVTEGDGNQGDPNGSPDSDRYGTGGGLGDGITPGGLGNRRVRSLPKPNVEGCQVTQRMEIWVDIQVDRSGKVIVATIGQKTNFQDKCIWDVVVAAAKRSTFSADQSANFRQTGWIKYVIVP